MTIRLATHQLTVPVAIAEGEVASVQDLSVAPEWLAAVDSIERALRLKGPRPLEPVDLEMPVAMQRGWSVDRAPWRFRCLVQWVPFPLDGGPPGWRGRVDVAYRLVR